MTTMASWLPDFIRLDTAQFPTMDAYYQYAFQQFSTDWHAEPLPTFKSLPVYFDDRVISWGLPEGFWHIISQTSSNTRMRIPDVERCERILWTKAIILAAMAGEPSIKHFLESSKNKKNRTVTRNLLFLNLSNACHLVILEKSGSAYRLVSSYHIGEGSKKWQGYRLKPHVPL